MSRMASQCHPVGSWHYTHLPRRITALPPWFKHTMLAATWRTLLRALCTNLHVRANFIPCKLEFHTLQACSQQSSALRGGTAQQEASTTAKSGAWAIKTIAGDARRYFGLPFYRSFGICILSLIYSASSVDNPLLPTSRFRNGAPHLGNGRAGPHYVCIWSCTPGTTR